MDVLFKLKSIFLIFFLVFLIETHGYLWGSEYPWGTESGDPDRDEGQNPKQGQGRGVCSRPPETYCHP